MVFSHTAANSHSFHCFRLLLLMKNKQQRLGAEECSLQHSQHAASAGVDKWSWKGICGMPGQSRVSKHSAQHSGLQFLGALGASWTQQGNSLQGWMLFPVSKWKGFLEGAATSRCTVSRAVFQSGASKQKSSLVQSLS